MPFQKPPKKIEITQTEITRIETVYHQMITQTVTDVETQTSPRLQTQQPQLVTITKAINPDPETMQQLLQLKKPFKEQEMSMTIQKTSKIAKSSSLHMKATSLSAYSYPTTTATPYETLSAIMQSMKTESMKPGPEKELRSIYYTKKSEEMEQGKCNCCKCGKKLPAMYESAYPTLKKPTTTQPTQHEALCADCKLKKVQKVLKAQDPLKKVPKKYTCDQEICTCAPTLTKGLKKPFPCKMKKEKMDQGCTAKIPKMKRKPKMMDNDEDQDSVQCTCSGIIETKEGLKRVHCACGDPD